MSEFLLAFFVVVTIFIDTLAVTLKGNASTKRLAMVYVVSQVFTYITRFSFFLFYHLLA